MKKALYITAFTFVLFLAPSQPLLCQNKVGGNYTFETECYGSELDGSITVQAWGNGKNRSDAIEQAKKNAIRDVIFKGIQQGKSDCDRSPLITEPHVMERNKEYFYKFFADGGEFNKYITLKDEQTSDKIKRDKKNARESVTHAIVIRINSFELKRKLITDGLITNNY